MGVGAHVGFDEEVVDAIDRGALVTSSLAAGTFAIQTTPTLTARRQFKRSVVWSRSKRSVAWSHSTKAIRPGSGQQVVAQMAAAVAIVVVVVVERLMRTFLSLIGVVVVRLGIVDDVVVVVIDTMVVMKLRLAGLVTIFAYIFRWPAVPASFLLSEASVVTLVAQRDTR